MFSYLDLYTVQFSKDELETLMPQIKTGLNIIYSNCVCDIRVGNEYVTTDQFNTLLYNEKNNGLLMLSKGSGLSKDDLLAILDEHYLKYGEVTFAPLEGEYDDISHLSKMYFVKDETSLIATLESSNNVETLSIYYPCIKGTISFGYITGVHKKIVLDKIFFEGILALDDKIIFLVTQRKKYSKKKDTKVTAKSVLKIIKKFNIPNEISYDRSSDIINVKNRKQEKVKRYQHEV